MYGLKSDDLRHLEHLRGEDAIQIVVGEFQIHFATGLKSNGGISVEGRCELLDASGRIVDVWDRGQRSTQFQFFDLLGKTIRDVEIDSEKSFVLTIADGSKLRVVDDSDQYESFSVGGMFV
jgi:hypothetical protein